MNMDYVKRRVGAAEISHKLRDLNAALILVGSVAYNSAAVTVRSDLDLVCILDFSVRRFQELSTRLQLDFNLKNPELYDTKEVNSQSFVFSLGEYDLAFHCWDYSAFENVVTLNGENYFFKENMDGISTHERLRNLAGNEIVLSERNPIGNGTLLKVRPFYEDASGIYLGTQSNNLLLNPKILNENVYIEMGIIKFYARLKERIEQYYGSQYDLNAIANALPEKVQRKLPPNFRFKISNTPVQGI